MLLMDMREGDSRQHWRVGVMPNAFALGGGGMVRI